MKKTASIFLAIIIFSLIGFSQDPNSADEKKRVEAEKRALGNLQRNAEKDADEASQREQERKAKIAENEETLRKKRPKKPPLIETPNETDKQLLALTEQEKLTYQNYLNDEKQGVFIVYSYPNCELYQNDMIIDTTCENNGFKLKGGGSYYSFRNKNNLSGNWVDLHLKNEMLYARGNAKDHKLNMFGVMLEETLNGYVQGIIVNLGNSKLDEVNENHVAFTKIKNFTPPKSYEEAKKISSDLAKGIAFDKYILSESAKFEVGNTYLLRSIPYHLKSEYYSFPDKAIDLIVAFQIVKREQNRVLITWKTLLERKPPKLTQTEKGEKVKLQKD